MQKIKIVSPSAETFFKKNSIFYEMPDFNSKMHQFDFRSGSTPEPAKGSLQRSPYPLAVFKGTYFWREKLGRKGEKWEDREREEEGKGEEGCRIN